MLGVAVLGVAVLGVAVLLVFQCLCVEFGFAFSSGLVSFRFDGVLCADA